MTPSDLESRDVHVKVPARPGYLVVARLALSAICRLTPLEHADVADLKLAVTEAASGFVSDDCAADVTMEFTFRLRDQELQLELAGTPVAAPTDELDLSRAILEATVDDVELDSGRARLVKRLAG
ncbi:MAG: hypothetical protein WD993_11220 [Thermoleophilaceae bacterium]